MKDTIKSKEILSQIIFDLGHSRSKSFDRCYNELCDILEIKADEKSKEIFRKYRQTWANLDGVTDHFYRLFRGIPETPPLFQFYDDDDP